MHEHTVKQGECIESIAYDYGFHPDTIWLHENNKTLKEKRGDPNVLKEGDIVFVPDITVREEKVSTGKKHTFYHKGGMTSMNMQICDVDGPYANVPYIFKIETSDKREIKDVHSNTNKDGWLKEVIPCNAVGGEIIVDPGEYEEKIPFQLGHLDPVDEGFRGVQAILNNLGFYCGEEDDEIGSFTIEAVRRFQREIMKLKEEKLLPKDSKKIDDETLQAILNEHSSGSE